MGDVIEGTGEENVAAMTMVALVKAALDKAQLPIYWSIGNHDLRAVTKEQFRDIVDQPALNYAWDDGDYRFIVLDLNEDKTVEEISEDVNHGYPVDETSEDDPAADDDPNEDGDLPPGTIRWLREQLSTEKRVFIFCHYPFDTKTITSADGAAKEKCPLPHRCAISFGSIVWMEHLVGTLRQSHIFKMRKRDTISLQEQRKVKHIHKATMM